VADLWKCPKCGNQYGKPNQSHSCIWKSTVEILRHDEFKIALFNLIELQLKDRIEFASRNSNKAIIWVHKTAFAIFYWKRDSIEIRFYLTREHDFPPVFKIMKRDEKAKKIAHLVRVYDEDDVDDFLIDLLVEAFEVAK